MTRISAVQGILWGSPVLFSLLFTVEAAFGEEPDAVPLPLVEVCLLPDEMKGNTCAAFFVDKDGYEICLKDEMSGKMHCSSSYRLDDGSMRLAPEHRSGPSVNGLRSTQF
ncbi:hypothetical protein ABK249_29135 [Neorhizobium sp. Rsf11]|uniref:Uncharacterized protein n=2 Tax=Neorhizobium TaxID=1525371 RepID=A0ABV0MB91_9HYPH|nr:hypothetical protein [Neorhizobium petrolearium]MCC2611100.1 hypothetical protein [Neorhizobium petrolearium]WGI66316.1 hypothetical protein QEO92_14785 [Neorhizobium petrolearium]